MSKTELIEKAVNIFNGKWPSKSDLCVYMYSFESENVWECGSVSFNSLFTREEFNAAADRMRGKPDWSELPPETEWLGQDRCGKWKPMVGPKPTTERGYWMTHHHLMPQPHGTVIGDWRNTLEKRPEQKIVTGNVTSPLKDIFLKPPVSHWFEAGELPPVGSTELDCKIKGKAYEQIKAFKVLAHENGKAVIASYHNEREHWAEIESYHKRTVNFTPYVISKPYFLPIEPIKTDKEKAIEFALSKIHNGMNRHAAPYIIEQLYDAGLLRLPDQK